MKYLFGILLLTILPNGNWVITDKEMQCDFHIDYYYERTITHNYGCGQCYWLFEDSNGQLQRADCSLEELSKVISKL